MGPRRDCKSKKTKTRGKVLKEPRIYFIDINVEELYNELKNSTRFEDKEIHSNLEKAIFKIQENPFCGIRVPSKLWPKEYITRYDIKILYKYDLPNGWRLIYTIRGQNIEVISIIIEWFSHKVYERKFKY
jgi:Txe/YoeB family toxin of Txe-Axe toxin-antitoxin module